MKENNENLKGWISEMIERECIPKAERPETTRDFCKRYDIVEQTYYYQASKKENAKKILENSLNIAKREVPEILQVLIENAKKGKEKSIEMYMEYIMKLAKKLDLNIDTVNITKEDKDKVSKLLDETL